MSSLKQDGEYDFVGGKIAPKRAPKKSSKKAPKKVRALAAAHHPPSTSVPPPTLRRGLCAAVACRARHCRQRARQGARGPGPHAGLLR